jgi:hypothetical protein
VDDQGYYVVYDLLKQIYSAIRPIGCDTSVSFCDPWMLWKDPDGISGCDRRFVVYYPICEMANIPETPQTNGRIAVWIQEDGEIIGFDLETTDTFLIRAGPKREINNIFDWIHNVSVAYRPGNLNIHGDTVIWSRSTGDDCLIDMYDLKSRKLLSSVQTGSSGIWSLRASDRYLVWKTYETSDDPTVIIGSIIMYDLQNQERKTIKTGIESYCDVDLCGDIVVWDEKRNSATSDIFGYNLKSGREFPICLGREDQLSPKISGNTVIWLDDRQQDWLSKLLKKEPSNIRGKTFRHWPGQDDSK